MFDFPPPPNPSESGLYWRLAAVAGLTIGVAGGAAWLLRIGRRAKWFDPLIWLGIATLLWLSLSSIVRGIPEVADPGHKFAWNVNLAFGVGIAAGFIATLVRLARQGDQEIVKGVLIAMTCVLVVCLICLPPVQSARNGMPRSQCKNNLKQVGLALHNYHETWHSFPQLMNSDVAGPARSWRVSLLPYVDAAATYNAYDLTKPWDDPANAPFARQQISTYSCLSDRARQAPTGEYHTSYTAPVGPHRAWRPDQAMTFREFTDGTSNTIQVVEACGQRIIWTEPRDVPIDVVVGINQPGSQRHRSEGLLSSYHRDGAHVLLVDGSARFVSQDISPTVLEALLSADQGDTVGEF